MLVKCKGLLENIYSQQMLIYLWSVAVILFLQSSITVAECVVF